MDYRDLTKKEFWAQLFPDLSIETLDFNSVERVQTSDIKVNRDIDDLMVNEAYLRMDGTSKLSLKSDFASVVAKLVENNLLGVFALVYDEFWALHFQYEEIFKHFLADGYKMLPAIWVWHLDPAKKEFGWEPHRDRDYTALDKDGKPKFLTLWLPITDADPNNGCIYVVPAQHDRVYGSPQDTNINFEFNGVRALPAKVGDAFIWNHAIFHWGGRANDYATHPRMSIAFEFMRGDVTPDKDKIYEPLQVMPFEERLSLIAKQIIQYTHMYDFDENMINFAREILVGNKSKA